WEWSYSYRLTEPQTMTLPTRGRLSAAAVSNDGTRVFANTFDALLHVWDTTTAQVIHTFRVDKDSGWAPTPDGSHVVVAMPDELSMYEASTGRAKWHRPLRTQVNMHRLDRKSTRL